MVSQFSVNKILDGFNTFCTRHGKNTWQKWMDIFNAEKEYQFNSVTRCCCSKTLHVFW